MCILKRISFITHHYHLPYETHRGGGGEKRNINLPGSWCGWECGANGVEVVNHLIISWNINLMPFSAHTRTDFAKLLISQSLREREESKRGDDSVRYLRHRKGKLEKLLGAKWWSGLVGCFWFAEFIEIFSRNSMEKQLDENVFGFHMLNVSHSLTITTLASFLSPSASCLKHTSTIAT